MPTWNIRIFEDTAEIEVNTNEGRSFMHLDLELPLQFIEDDESIRIEGSNGGFIGVDPENDPGKIIMEAPGGSHSWFDIEIPIIEDIVAYVRAGVQHEHDFAAHNNPYAGIQHGQVRNIPANATNAISYNSIQDGNEMVTFHGNLNRPNNPRYYKRSTFNSLQTANAGLKRNPFTQQLIQPGNVTGYTARIQEGGKKTRRRRGMRRRKSIRRL